MQANMNSLLEVLDQEAACYRDMKTVLAAEEKAISLSEKERLETVLREKEALVARIQQHEKKRQTLVDRLAGHLGLDRPMVTVSGLATVLQARDSAALLGRADRLRSALAEIRSTNKRNQQLIGHYRSLIKGSLRLLADLIDDHAVYTKPGVGQTPPGSRGSRGRVFCGTG